MFISPITRPPTPSGTAALDESLCTKASLSVKDVADVKSLFPHSLPTVDEFISQALSELKEKRADILGVPPNLRSFENTYLAFDALVADATSRIQILWVVSLLHSDEGVRRHASERRTELRRFLAEEVQGCRPLYETFKDFNDCLVFSDDERAIRNALMTQFRRQGMELSDSDFEVLSTLKGELLKLESAYMENIHNRRRSIAFTLEELEGVDKKLLATFEQREGKFILYSNCPIVSLLESCTEANTRKALYEFMSVQCAQDNEVIVKDLIAKRDRFAKLLDYPSFAAYQLEEEMVKDEKGVRAFLENLSAVALPKARKEAGAEPIEPYDVARLCRPSFNSAEFQRHLPFHQTFSSVMEALSRITGLEFVEKTASLWDPGVKLVEVSQKGTVIGFIAYDLAARSSKHVYGYCIDVLPRYEGAAVAVVISKFEDVESGLTPENLLTLLHESGHACHQLLGKALRPSKCGYHVASDFLEVPSTLFEELGWYRPLLEFLNIPEPLIEAHLASRTASIGMSTTGLIERALLSLELFGEGEVKEVEALREKVRAAARPYVRFHPEALPECFFHHLVDPLYGSRFYSYLWSQMVASACFDHIVCELDLQAYRVFCDEVLSKGGGVDPSVLLRQFLGGEPTLSSFAKLFD